ncbi:uncharacterized protein ACNLHF_009220 [Anomaloglossus baeobatrachus]|uniref:uncharacterized protein LOC142289738 n=1 Tax=Anomaloglossus baeobatrachus TaxID=238106 RepID=UPI003F50AAA0
MEVAESVQPRQDTEAREDANQPITGAVDLEEPEVPPQEDPETAAAGGNLPGAETDGSDSGPETEPVSESEEAGSIRFKRESGMAAAVQSSAVNEEACQAIIRQLTQEQQARAAKKRQVIACDRLEKESLHRDTWAVRGVRYQGTQGTVDKFDQHKGWGFIKEPGMYAGIFVFRRDVLDHLTRSLSYSELEFPAPSFLQRFGSLTWRKKRFNTFEYSNASPNVSTTTELQWSVGGLERPAVRSELDLESRNPKSCIVHYPFAQSTSKIFEHCSNREQLNLEISTSFDCIAVGDENNSPNLVTTQGKNVQLPFAFPERLERENEDSLPCWTESVFKDYMSQNHQTPGSPIYQLLGDSQPSEFIENCEEPDQYQSSLYHHIQSEHLMLEESFIKESKVKTSLTQKKVQQSPACKSKNKEAEKITQHIPHYTSILSQDTAQIRTVQKYGNLSQVETLKKSSCSQKSLKLSTEFSKQCQNQTSLAHANDIQKDELQKETTDLQDSVKDQTQNLHRQILENEGAQSLSDSSTVPLLAPMKGDCKSQASPYTARIRYKVIITMTKEEKKQAQLQRLAQEMVKAEKLVGQDLRMSSSLESQASGFYRADLTEMTAQYISETSQHIEKYASPEIESPDQKGGETPKGAQVDRSVRSTVDAEFLFSISGSDQVDESYRVQLTKMEKTDFQQKLKIPRTPIKKNDCIKLLPNEVSPQLYVGHVKGLQRVFETISSKDDALHHKLTAKSQQCLREKRPKEHQDVSVTPGVHGPVFSTVYNPLRKDNLDKKSGEQGTVTIIDNSGETNTSIVSTLLQSNVDSNKKKMESKDNTKKYIANVELTNAYHSDNEASYKKVRNQHPDLKLSPKTQTPPSYRSRNNSSISLGSPRGWKNEIVLLRSPLSSAHRFENQRNNSCSMPSQISTHFFFPGGNESYAKMHLKTKQNVNKNEENPIHSKDITKTDHENNSEEANKAELKLLPQSIPHDVSHIFDGKEALHNQNCENFANTKNNKIQEDCIANARLGAGEMHELFTGTFLAERMFIDDTSCQEISTSEILKSKGKEVEVQETMNKVESKLTHDILSVISQGRKPPDYIPDVSINCKLENTLREKHSNEFKNHNAPWFMDINYSKGNNMAMSNDNGNRLAGDFRTTKEVKSKYQPTTIHHKIVNKEKHDSVSLNKRTNYERKYFKESDNGKPFEEETNTRLKCKVKELKKEHSELFHWGYSTKNNLKLKTNTVLENQSPVHQHNPANDQFEGKAVIVLAEGKHITHVESDVMRSADNNEERKIDLPDRFGGEENPLQLNKVIAESYIEQTEIYIPVGDEGVKKRKSIHKKEKHKIEEGSSIGFSYNNDKATKEKGLINQEQPDMSSIITADRQIDHLCEIDEGSRIRGNIQAFGILVQSEQEVAELRDQTDYIIRDISSKDEHRARYEQNMWTSEVLLTNQSDQVLQMDLNPNVVYRDVIDHGHKFRVSEETERGQMENICDILENTTVVKNTVNMIEEKTDEVDISTVDMKDQSVLGATVTKDEPVFITSHQFASDIAVNTEDEESHELMKDIEFNEEQEASEKIFLADSSGEFSGQPDNLKQDLDNTFNTGVNTSSHLSNTHVLCEDTAQIDVVIVDHILQNTGLITEPPDNERQTFDEMNQFVDNNVVERIIVVSGDDVSIFSEKDKNINIKQSVNEPVDQAGELVLDKTEQIGNISATKGLIIDNNNSRIELKLPLTMYEAGQGSLSHLDDQQNIIDELVVENSCLTVKEKENDSLNKLSQQVNQKEVGADLLNVPMGQAEKLTVLQNDKCLIVETEDAWFDKKDVKKSNLIVNISNEMHEPGKFVIPNHVLTCTDIKDSTNDLPNESTQFSKVIENLITYEVRQWKSQADNLSMKENQAESLHDELPPVTLHTSDPQYTLHSEDPQTTGTLHSDDPLTTRILHRDDPQTTKRLHSDYQQTTGTLLSDDPQTTRILHSDDPQTTKRFHSDYQQTTGTLLSDDPQTTRTLYSDDPLITGTLYSDNPHTTGTLHSSDSQTTGTLHSKLPQTTRTFQSSDPLTTGTLDSDDLQATRTLHSDDPQTTGTLHTDGPQTTRTLQSDDPQTMETLHSDEQQTTRTLHSDEPQTTRTLHSDDPQTTRTLHSDEIQTTGTLYSDDPQTSGTLHNDNPQTTGTLHRDDPQTTGTLRNDDPQTTRTLHSSNLQTTLQGQKGNENEILERNNIDTHDFNIHVSLNELYRDISGILKSDVEKIKNNTGNMSGRNRIYSKLQQNSVVQIADIVEHSQLPKSEKHILEDTVIEYNINSTEEEELEASENIEIWVNKLRQLETPDFLKHLKEPRQPRSSGLSMYGTLPPIKEDQSSPKSDRFVFRLPVPDIKEYNILSEKSKLTEEPNVREQTETPEPSEKKYSWERNTERSAVRSSPLELMRKHFGDEVSRSDSYKNIIAQNLSQRQSSIIGCLLLSERLDKKTDTSERKPYSRLESSFLLSSYLKPQIDNQGVTKETYTISENTSENDPSSTANNDTCNRITEEPKQEEKVESIIPKMDHVADIISTELPSKLQTAVSSTLKVIPDVWHHPEKSHGNLNPRPGKLMLFSEPGFKGNIYEIFSDVSNMCDWKLQGTISVRIIRGGWLLYEKQNFRGKRVMLSEGDTDLICPWEIQDKSIENSQEDTKRPKSWIGSLRHVVRDFQVPRISLFMNENGEGNKITILGATPNSCVDGQRTKTESIIVHSGLWLVYSKQFFEGDPYILEPGGYPNRKAWNGHDSHLCSFEPARIGGPSVEKPNEPKILLFQHSEFKGHSWEVTRDLHLLQGEPNQQEECLTSVGSLKVLGGCWVAYEKEGFHGHQYLLEEGEYQNWSQWGGCTEELGSLRHIRTDFSEPEIILYESPGCLEGSCLRLNEALADVEVAQYGTNTCSVQVLNGVWVAYENVDFSGEQYILEKGIYGNYQDWGAKDSHISSVQPVLQVGGQNIQYLPKIQLFSEPNFHGDCMMHTEDLILLPKTFSLQSCRIEGGSWILYENENCCGKQYILDEGDYPSRTAMGCQAISIVRSLKKVPLYFSIPSISLHGLERFEGKELEFQSAVRSLRSEGYNNHVLSIKVASGIWIVYEHSDFRGRQWLLQQTQIANWLLFSGIQQIGSLFPIRQRRVYFRLRNHALGLFLGVPEAAENMKAALVKVTEPKVGSCNLWYYEEGRIKNQMTPQMSLQVVGMATPGTKVAMWSEGRKPIQTWSLEDSGLIISCLFEGLCLDIKGGHSYDSEHVVVWETAEDRPTQFWDLEVF